MSASTLKRELSESVYLLQELDTTTYKIVLPKQKTNKENNPESNLTKLLDLSIHRKTRDRGKKKTSPGRCNQPHGEESPEKATGQITQFFPKLWRRRAIDYQKLKCIATYCNLWTLM